MQLHVPETAVSFLKEEILLRTTWMPASIKKEHHQAITKDVGNDNKMEGNDNKKLYFAHTLGEFSLLPVRETPMLSAVSGWSSKNQNQD